VTGEGLSDACGDEGGSTLRRGAVTFVHKRRPLASSRLAVSSTVCSTATMQCLLNELIRLIKSTFSKTSTKGQQSRQSRSCASPPLFLSLSLWPAEDGIVIAVASSRIVLRSDEDGGGAAAGCWLYYSFESNRIVAKKSETTRRNQKTRLDYIPNTASFGFLLHWSAEFKNSSLAPE